ncbi:MAG TPA: LysR family transcriptional regulator [Xanthobacteraceae bacterium]|nr:LysR family transcriptional regulator [Xanthobacteraceae bacterium]
MDLDQLRYFAHVAKLRSFTVASQRLNVAQSALSRQVKSLEQELGVQLLSRSTHSVVPTEAGLRLLEMSDYLLRYADQIPDAVRETAAEPAGSVALGLLPAVAYIVTPPLLMRLRKEMPRVSVMVSEGLGIFLRERLLLGQVDLAVMTAGRLVKGLTEIPVIDEEMVLTGSPRLLERFSEPTELRQLAGVPILTTQGFKEVILPVARAAGVSLQIEMEQNSLMALKVMLQQSFGLSILPYTVVHDEWRDGRLAIRRISEPKVMRQLAIVKPEYRPISRAFAAVEGILIDELRRMPVSPDAAIADRA